MSEFKQKDIDDLIKKMESISPRVKELVKPIKDLPKKYQEVALIKLYRKTQEWKQEGYTSGKQEVMEGEE